MKRFFRMTADCLRFHFRLIRHVRWMILPSYGLSLLQSVVPTLNTVLLAYAASLLSEKVQLGGALILAVIGISFTSVTEDISIAIRDHLQRKMSAAAQLPMFKEFHSICCSLDYRYRELREANDLIERAAEAITVQYLRNVLGCIPNIIQGVVSYVLPCILLWQYGWYMPLIATVFAVVLCVLSYYATKEANTFYSAEAMENRFIETYSEQIFDKNKFRELKAYNKRGWLRAKWERSFDVYRKKTFRQEMRFQLLNNLSPLTVIIATLVMIAAFVLVNRGKQLAAIPAMVVTVINACSALCFAMERVRREYFVFQEFSEAYSNYFTLEKRCQSQPQRAEHGITPVEVELNDVHFSYDDEKEALSGVTLDIRPGEKLAVVGENGSGKTTLAKLILSLYKPTSGTLTLSDAAGTLQAANASAVMQEYVRYLLSVRENIGFGDPEKLTDDAALTAAYESVTGEPLFDALDAQLGAKFGGRELSGGQWQRLALARAYLKEAPLIVLDEPNASIDAFAEAAMIKRMFAMAENKTCIFITHRLTTTALADRIIVMKDGRICEEGTHDELMRRNGEYARMYKVQAEMYA